MSDHRAARCEAVIDVFLGRSGFDDVWDSLDAEIRDEIREEVESVLVATEPDAVGTTKGPPHYNTTDVEVLDQIRVAMQRVTEAGVVRTLAATDLMMFGAALFNELKYLARAPHKGKLVEDWGKAAFYRGLREFVLKPEQHPDPRSTRDAFDEVAIAREYWGGRITTAVQHRVLLKALK